MAKKFRLQSWLAFLEQVCGGSLPIKGFLSVLTAVPVFPPGKTTLVNHILTANHGKKIAVIENEVCKIMR